MSHNRSLRFLLVLLFAAFASVALVLADASALGQNANSSTTEETMQSNNANMMPKPSRGRRGRRGTRRKVAAEPASDMTPAAAQDDDSKGDLSGNQTDLSGTYTGHLTMTGGHEMSGEATLTITGNTFQLEGEGMSHSGRVYAVTTRGYIGAAFYFPDIKDPASNTAVVANVRARKSGDRLTLSPAPGTRTKMTFGAGGGGGGGRRGRR